MAVNWTLQQAGLTPTLCPKVGSGLTLLVRTLQHVDVESGRAHQPTWFVSCFRLLLVHAVRYCRQYTQGRLSGVER